MRQLVVRPLTVATGDRAFPLALLSRPGLTLRQWQNFVVSYAGTAREKGILVVENPQGHVLGFCSYLVVPTLGSHPVLTLHTVLVPKILNEGCLLGLLLEGCENLAKEQGCAAIRVAAPMAGPRREEGGRGLASRLETLGFQSHGVWFGKSFGPSRGNATARF
jgi:hypothetical protein